MLRILLFLVALVVLGVLIYFGDASQVLSILSRVNPLTIILLLALSTFSLLLRVLRFKFLIGKRIDYLTLLPIHIYGLAISNLVPGRLSEPVRAILLKGIRKIPLTVSLACVFFERVSDMLMLFLFGAFAFFFVNASAFSVPFFAVFAILLFVVVTSQWKTTQKIIYFFLRLIKQKYLERLTKILFKEAKLTRQFSITLAFALIIWLLDGLIFFIALQSVGANVPYPMAVSFFGISMIVGLAIFFLPGGIGGMEGAMATLLSFVGVNFTVALSGVLLARFLTLWYSMLLGLISSFFVKKK